MCSRSLLRLLTTGLLVWWAWSACAFAQQQQPPRPDPLEHDPALRLPIPAGTYPLGTALFSLRRLIHQPDQPEAVEHAPEAADHVRELMVQVWYPATTVRGIPVAAYLPDPALLTAMIREHYLDLTPDVLKKWKQLQTHAFWNAPLATAPKRLPLLLFSPGFGVSRSNYTALIEALASQGYVVAAIDHPYCGLTVLPDGRVLSFSNQQQKSTPEARVQAMAQDAVFVREALLNPQSPSRALRGSPGCQARGPLRSLSGRSHGPGSRTYGSPFSSLCGSGWRRVGQSRDRRGALCVSGASKSAWPAHTYPRADA